MTPERWQKIDQLFHSALACEPAERTAFLVNACDGDDALRLEVESLISSHEQGQSFIETPAGDVAAELLSTHNSRFEPGQQIDNYKIVRQLGSGGMGEVYLADDTRLNRKIALKLLPPQFTIDPDRVRRFDQEAQAASALNHPNIVTIHEIGNSGSVHFIATEFIDGETLREHLTQTQMTVGDLLDAGVQIASALQAAHEAGIVHRDIKPENIMLRRDRVVKVLDFGLAKLTPQHLAGVDEQGSMSMVQSNPGMVLGTVGYMSPEQARGHEVDARTDIWSLGVVLYEMLSGRSPFEGETPSHVIVSILEGEPPLPRNAEMPEELERIISKALSKKTSERYQTAAEMLEDLRNLKEELTVEARLKRGLSSNSKGKEFVVTETVGNSPARTAHLRALPTGSVEYLVTEIKRHKTLAGAALLIVLAGAIALAYVLIIRNKANVAALGKKSIAVLPLSPINPANRDDIYELGIADSLIHRLSSMHGIIVRPLSATRRYSDISQDPITAGKEQQVDYVLSSNYQLADGKISITAQLINVATGQIEETYKLEKDRSDVLAMQDAVAAEIGDRLLAEFAITSNPQTLKRGTTNEEAYRLYLQGMYLVNNRNLEDARKSVAALEQAVSLDPNYARAWAGLAYAHRTVSLYRGSLSTYETYQRAIKAIDMALALDPNLSEAHSALCENKYLYEWDFGGAEEECKLAIELDPDSAQAHEIYSRYLMGRGRHDEAIAEIKTAIDLEPASRFSQRNYGRALYYARRYAEAEDQFKRVVAMDQNFAVTYTWLISTLTLQGKDSEAFDWFRKLLSVRKVDEETIQSFETSFQTSGWHGVLREWLKRFDKVGGDNLSGAAFHSELGDKDKAFEYLEVVYQRREISMAYLRVDPRLDPLRDDPRFDELLRRVESR